MAVRGLLSRERENDTAAPKICDCYDVGIQATSDKRFWIGEAVILRRVRRVMLFPAQPADRRSTSRRAR
jgi:hypothetical protein